MVLTLKDLSDAPGKTQSRGGRQPARAPADAPDIVYIILDDVGYGWLGCYGGPIDTPNIDKLAANGLLYNNWHTTALCSPSRACLLTGRIITQ